MSLSADLKPQTQRKNVPFLIRIYSQTQSKGQCRVQHRQNLFLPVLVGTCLEVHNTCTASTTRSGVNTAGELLQQSLGWAAWQLHKAVVNYTDKLVLKYLDSWLQSPTVYQRAQLFDRYSVMMGSSHRFNKYGNEFGMGKAVALRSGYANKYDGKVTWYPGYEGGGSIDLEVCLPPDSMIALESDEEFMEAVSVSNQLH
ncbi:hypothetical protein CJ030_MR3G017019 [Morella rubra]|uniref:BAHD acyltransferase DCR n=1 Tax=Morella rubra TaxID=262757 RepID=A0A6A1W4Y2_9ROSI|nr:hypothetical protein CJ030_MR3G017019 [Morella rubra]